MQDYSLKFFSRDVQLSQKEELFISKYTNRPLNNRNYKLEALGLLTYLQMLLFSDGETGFYYDVSDNRFLLLANKLGISPKQLNQTLNWCFEYSILDGAMYQKYQILTSYKMQDDYSKVLDKPAERVRAQNIKMEYVYQDCVFTQNYKNALQKYLIAVQKKGIAQQKMGEETRPEQSKQDDIKKEESITSGCVNTQLEKFLSQFPNKTFNKTKDVPDNINFDLLAQKIKESSFLMNAKNLDIEWFFDKANYEKVITDYYKNYESKKEKSDHNFTQRDYSNDELNQLFDDLENIEL